MTVHRYHLQSLLGDYAKGIAGMAVSGGLWALAPAAHHVMLIFGSLAGLFLLFTLRTVARHRTRVVITSETIGTERLGSGSQAGLPWGEIDAISLRYYSTRRQRDKGWMTLVLSAGSRRIVLDSSLGGFDAIAAQAAATARDRHLHLSDTTRANFVALGHAVYEPSEEAAFPQRAVPLA